MKFKQTPDQNELKRLFDYHNDGYFIWLVRSRYHNTLGKKAGYIDPKGYTIIRINNIAYLAHRLIFKWHTGLDPEVIDHIDRDPTNNRIENLSNGTHSDNNQNRAYTKHVFFCKRTNKYRAHKMIKGKRFDKRFDTEQEAIDYILSLTN